jgi:hypothetical protein
MVLTLIPCDAPSSAGEVERHRGSVFFGFFLLDKQKKETRQSGETT